MNIQCCDICGLELVEVDRQGHYSKNYPGGFVPELIIYQCINEECENFKGKLARNPTSL